MVERRPAGADEIVKQLEHGIPDFRAARGIIGRISSLLSNIFREDSDSSPWEGGDSRDKTEQPLVVAVMPIADNAAGPELGAVGAGQILTDLFLHLLTDGAELHTVAPMLLREAARSEGRSLEEACEDPSLARALGKRVGGNAILSGSIDRLTGGYVVNARITELATGRVYRSYRAQAPDWDGLLSALASSVLREKETPGPTTEADLLERIPSRSLEAYALFVRGRDLADMGQYEEALSPLAEAVALDPELALAWSEMGCAYYFVGDLVRSRAAHWKAAEHVNHASLKERLWIAAATAWVHSENGDLYRRRLQDFVDAFPDDRDGPFYMGHSYVELDNRPDKAIPWLAKACELTPTYYPTTRELAEAYEKIGQPERAREILERYLERSNLTEFARQSACAQLEKLERK
jgi:tetratricopeptide (TPR) repeat protein